VSIVQLFPGGSQNLKRIGTPFEAAKLPPPQADPFQGLSRDLLLTPTIFHETWWLQVSGAHRYREAEVHHGGKLVGRLPYQVSRRHGFDVSVLPDLTHLLGPAIDDGAGSSNTRWLRRLDILKDLVAKLPRVAFFSQVCHPYTADVLGFQACGFDTSVQFTAEIEPAGEDALWLGMRDKTRNVIRRAQERMRLEVLQDAHEFGHFYRANLARDGDRSYFDLDCIPALYQEAHARNQAQILAVRDSRGSLAAAVCYVWDERRMWYLLSTRDSSIPDNGAVSLLVWKGMCDAAARRLVFDFDGVASQGAARFFAGFGASLRPRFAVHRASAGYALARTVVTFIRGRSNRNHFAAP
jgi:hypothetical protein